ITGGGIIGNTKRVTPKNMSLKIDWNAWEVLPIFKLIQNTGKITDEEMRHVFNMGIGLIAIVDKNNADIVLNLAEKHGEKGCVMGVVE
ncbi:MAG TPA: AIR synthase-related protein, partial [Melioribacteraceae bacterium]|nr:AIR synthase-related protein [Melioribacteraceae bacterium]